MPGSSQSRSRSRPSRRSPCRRRDDSRNRRRSPSRRKSPPRRREASPVRRRDASPPRRKASPPTRRREDSPPRKAESSPRRRDFSLGRKKPGNNVDSSGTEDKSGKPENGADDLEEPKVEIEDCAKRANGDPTWQACISIKGVAGRVRALRGPPRPARSEAENDGEEMKKVFMSGGVKELQKFQQEQRRTRVR
mmetsp:Transcript_15040/g.23964  ORF Transcript_15040/g.23964 Transcript_15040/m.23964 type:complete len:193 (-) Transcript_15040:46-624(-)